MAGVGAGQWCIVCLTLQQEAGRGGQQVPLPVEFPTASHLDHRPRTGGAHAAKPNAIIDETSREVLALPLAVE